MNIRAVIFDFGGVICFPPTEEQWREAAEYCGAPAVSFREAFWKHRDGYDGGGDPGEYWHGVAKLLGLSFDDRLVAGMIEREIGFWSRFDARVLAWASELRRNGIYTGILSNLPRPLGEQLRSVPGFLDHFDHVTFSYELGAVKPGRAIYRHAIEGLDIQPQEGLFLDDRDDNVLGGRTVGLHAEQFASWEDFSKRQLCAFGLPQPSR